MKKYIEKKGRFLKSIKKYSKQLVLMTVFAACLLFGSTAQTIQYKGVSDVLFATSDSRMVANVVEMGDSIMVEVLGIGYIHAGVLAFTFVYDTSKLTLVDKFFLNEIPFAAAVPAAMELSPSLPVGYGIDATQHDVIQGVTNMAYYKGGLYTSSYDLNDCWKVQYGEVDKALTLFLKKKATGTPIQSADLGLYVSYLPKREPSWGIDALQIGYKYGSGTNVHIGGGVFMDYFNQDMFAFRWASSVTTDEATNIKPMAATLNGSFERSKFNPAQDSVTFVDNPYFTSSVALPNTILDWDTVSRYGFIYSDADANIASVPFSKKINVDGTDYELTVSDLLNGSFTASGKTFSILPYNNASAAQTVIFNEELTNLASETDYYAWAYMFYAFQTSEDFPAVGEKISFTTLGCIQPSIPTGLAQQTVCIDAAVVDLQAFVDKGTELKWYLNGEELPPAELLANGETYYARAVDGACISEDSLAVLVTINSGPQISVSPAGAYTAMGSQTFVIVTDDNPTNAKTISVANPSIASAVLIGDTVVVFGSMAGNTEITYTSVNEFGCEASYIIPVQVGVGNPTGILAGKDFVKCNLSGGGDTAIVQIAYIMGGVSPWKVTISDDNGSFSVDTVINSLNDLPVNVTVTIPENISNVPQYTTYAITNITDVMGNSKQTHYGSVRIGTNPTPHIAAIANKTQTVCADANTLPISFTGVATTYSYSIDQQIGTMNYSANGIPSFVVINESGSPITATIIVTPEYWYNGVVCIGESDTAYITVLPKVLADFTTSVQGLGQIQFTDTSVNAVDWAWDFGDGTTSSAQSPLHTFAVSAPYTITLTVTSPDGCTVAISKTITVSATTNLAADFHINATEQCLTGNSFKFTNQSRISQPNGHVISDYLWDFGDGNTAVTANPTHTYALAGKYTVTLTVTESPTGTQSSISQTVSVVDLPVVSLQPLMAVCEGERLQVPMPVINWNGNTPTAGTWSLDGYLIDPVNTYVTMADNGKILRYTIAAACGNVITSAGAITVTPMLNVSIEPIVEVCLGEPIAVFVYTLNGSQQGLNVLYNIAFDGNALAAGFTNVNGAALTGNTITIPLPNSLPTGLYGATLTVESDGCVDFASHRIYVHVIEDAYIVQQPQSVTVCGEDGFTLSVTASGKNLTYQWYRNGLAISGATDSIYAVIESDSTVDFGFYHVEVSGSCGSAVSNTVEVKAGGLSLIVKWTDVIFISNENDYFVGYQWYRDGKPIALDGNYQSYVENGGLNGTYHVVVTYADGTKEESCPLTIYRPTSSRQVSVYPNPVQPYGEVIIDMGSYPSSEVEGSTLEIITMLGQQLAEITLTSPVQKVQLNVNEGIYLYRITTKKYEVIVGKIWVH